MVPEEDGGVRLEFREHTPQALLIGKAVRAVSGIRAALLLADAGYGAESAALLRMVSDFCTEITAVVEALYSGATTAAVQRFIDQYFAPLARTPEELAAQEKRRFVSREELMKAQTRLPAPPGLDSDRLIENHRFLNHIFDAYVHGASGTSTELYDFSTQRFMLRGQEHASLRNDHLDAVAGKLPGVVNSVGFIAMLMGHRRVQEQTASARRALVPMGGEP
jgi:hypothetical protein